MSAAPDVIAAAQGYIARGWAIVAVHGKTPIDEGWRERRFTDQEIFTSLNRSGCTGIGFPGGHLNSNIVPIDFDSEDGERFWREQHEARGLDPDDYPTVITPGKIKRDKDGNIPKDFIRRPGFHRYVSDTRGTLGNSEGDLRKLGLGINIRGNGQALLPPSPHPDGGRYRWIERHGLEDFDTIPACPDFVYDAIETKPKADRSKSDNITLDPDDGARRYCRAALDGEIINLARTVTDRNNALNNAALKLGSLHHHGAFTAGEVLAALRGACEQNGLIPDDGARAFEATFKSGWAKGLSDPRPIERREQRHANGDAREHAPETQRRLSISIADFLAVRIPPRKLLLGPWLKKAGSAMIHAWRGVGKTHVGVGAAAAIASGGHFLRWKAPEPARVLYIDGEMPEDVMQERFRGALDLCPALPSGQYLRLITPDRLPPDAIVPNLLTPEGQAAIEPDLEGTEVVFFDNVATLFRQGEDQNAANSWLQAQDYILRLRRRGIASVIIDHDNKSGGNRGTSAKHDVLETVMHLTEPKDYLQSQGARFNVTFTKARGFRGRDAEPFQAQLIETLTGPSWTVTDADDIMLERVAEMIGDGMKERDIRAELGIGGSKLASLKKALKKPGQRMTPKTQANPAAPRPVSKDTGQRGKAQSLRGTAGANAGQTSKNPSECLKHGGARAGQNRGRQSRPSRGRNL